MAINNSRLTLPPEGSAMSEQILRDPYNFDFLTLTDPVRERALKRALLIHLRDLLLELGRGFAFIGSQVPLPVGNRCSISTCSSTAYACTVILSSSSRPGSSNRNTPASSTFTFRRSTDHEDGSRRSDHRYSALRDRNEAIVELSFKNLQKPMGISTYTVTRELPKSLEEEIPSTDDLRGVVKKLRKELDAARRAEMPEGK